jgi:transposase
MELTHDLPTDPQALQALVLKLREQIQRLEHDNRLLHKIAFGPSTEKRPVHATGPGAPQGWLFAQEILAEAGQLAAQNAAEVTVTIPAYTRRRAKAGRRKSFPEELPVVRTTCELPPESRICDCGGYMNEFSEEVRRELERVETTVVHEIVLKKYACGRCHACVRRAPWRGAVIDKGLLGPGFLAHVITERFAHHMPYHRLERKYESEGLELSRSVLCSSMARCAELLEPIAEALKQEILASPVIHTDDTPVVIAESSSGGSRKGRVWIYLNPDGRHWYDFTETRERDGPLRVLGDYRGAIQADAYAGYDRLYLPNRAKEVACWAHLRRKFVDAETTDPALAKEAIDRIRVLFRIEAEADRSQLSPQARLDLRREKAAPLVEEFEAWMAAAMIKTLPKGPLGRAIAYGRNQWKALKQYLDDGRLSISNNAAERALRPFAVGRKNWLFFQRVGGGKTASILMSLLMTAKAAGINPRDYFRDVLLRISTCPDVASLTPHGWKAAWEPQVLAQRQRILDTLLAQA